MAAVEYARNLLLALLALAASQIACAEPNKDPAIVRELETVRSQLTDFGLFFSVHQGELQGKDPGTFATLIRGLDPQRQRFTQAQVAHLESRWDPKCAKLLLQGDFTPLLETLEILNQAHKTSLAFSDSVIAEIPDFTVPESLSLNGEFPQTENTLRERNRLILKFGWLQHRHQGLSDADIQTRLRENLHYLRLRILAVERNPKQQLGLAIGFVLKAADPFALYLPNAEAQSVLPGRSTSPVQPAYPDSLPPGPLRRILVSNDSVRIGVVQFRQFYGMTEKHRNLATDFRNALTHFNAERADCLVIDLRGNEGGIVAELNRILFHLLGSKSGVGDAAEIQSLDAASSPPGKALWLEKPVVVLLDALSTSASEALAATVQAHRRGIVIGDPHTRGKAWSQTVCETDNAALSFTSGIWGCRDGSTVAGTGVLPDITLLSLRGDITADDIFKCPSAYMPEEQGYAHPHFRPRTPFWNEEDLARLAAASQSRQASSPEFQEHLKLRHAIARRNRPRESLSLREDDYEPPLEIPLVEPLADAHLKEALRIAFEFSALFKRPTP